MKDREIVAAIVAGDPAGLAGAYDKYAQSLHGYCGWMLSAPGRAADAAQDTFGKTYWYQAGQLAARGIRVIEGEVTGIEVADDHLTGVCLRSAPVIPWRALVIGPRFKARHALLDGLGVSVTEHPLGIGHQIPADATGSPQRPGCGSPATPTSPQVSCRQPPLASPPRPRSTPTSPPATPPPR